MDRQTIRYFFFMALAAAAFILWSEWNKEYIQPPTQNQAAPQKQTKNSLENLKIVTDLPTVLGSNTTTDVVSGVADKLNSKNSPNLYTIESDVMLVKINPVGGDVVYVELKKYLNKVGDDSQGFAILDTSEDRYYLAQSGLLSSMGPDSNDHGRAHYISQQPQHESIAKNASKHTLNLEKVLSNGIRIIKRFTITKGSYVVDVDYIVNNTTEQSYTANMFGRIKRQHDSKKEGGLFSGLKTFSGVAIHSEAEKYKKFSFDTIRKEKYQKSFEGGWAAMVEHYFTSAWIPNNNQKHSYQTEEFENNIYGVRFVSPQIEVKPQTKEIISAKLFAGPEITDMLKTVSPGLELTVDYGFLWWLCMPLFWLLNKTFSFVGNWGIAIILTTVLIKLLFYKLSAYSYRSMGNMRKIQPEIELLKKRCGDDKQKFGKEIMELYRKEKINPLGGCLPMLVQIPVFISLYYVLLESVELRHANFLLWIIDLSAKDPFYVLPLIMGATMILQQKMSPPPPDPTQAKVMMFMPVIFTVLFLNFPAGLMLYWVVNNTLSIIQQWYITKSITNAPTNKSGSFKKKG